MNGDYKWAANAQQTTIYRLACTAKARRITTSQAQRRASGRALDRRFRKQS